MTPNNASHGSSNAAHSRKRSTPGRVLPAIPLALSKPRPSRAQQTTEPNVRAGASPAGKEVVAVSDARSPGVPDNVAQQPQTDPPSEQPLQHDAPANIPSAASPVSRGSASMSISNGATPELPADPNSEADLPAQTTSSPKAPMSPSSARKPTERFDMRPIRTELPPAFVPSAEQHTPQSGISTRPISQSIPHAHAHNPSTASIVFGGPDSTTSSPAPPQSAGSAFQPPQYPPLGAAQVSFFVPSGHAHHASEPQAHRHFHPGFGPPAPTWGTRHNYANHILQQPPFQTHGHVPFRYPPREVFTPAEVRLANGYISRSRSASQTSSHAPRNPDELQSPIPTDGGHENVKMMFHEPKVAFPGPFNPRNHQPHAPSNMPPPQMPPPDIASGPENAERLRDHVLAQFSDPALADCHLQILEDNGEGRTYIDGHKIILSRSPKLLELIQNSAPPASAALKTQVQIQLQSEYVRIFPLMQSLKYLYGGPLLSFDQFRHQIAGGESMPTNEERMENALQHCATGAWLQLPPVATRGLEVAGSLLHWDTISTALAFAVDGGLSHVWAIDDGSEDRISCSSSDDSLGRPDTTSAPTYDPYATQLLHRIIDFTVHMFPPDFYLDASAPQLAACARLPSAPLGHESRPSRSDPRLSKIRFGEMAMEDHQRPSFVTTTISSMLLSLPFTLLKCILEHFDLATRLGQDTTASIMRQVIAEREVRRTKALKGRGVADLADSADAHLVQNLYWEEAVEPSSQHRAGLRLVRRRRGIDTPPSTGSERSK